MLSQNRTSLCIGNFSKSDRNINISLVYIQNIEGKASKIKEIRSFEIIKNEKGKNMFQDYLIFCL